jgi:hypothetical protein
VASFIPGLKPWAIENGKPKPKFRRMKIVVGNQNSAAKTNN